jgi:hypothetical protein
MCNIKGSVCGKKEIRNERYHQRAAVVDVAARAYSPAAAVDFVATRNSRSL